MQTIKQLITIKEASKWATKFLDRDISESNISYLIQYGKILKHNKNGKTLIAIDDLKKYYTSYYKKLEIHWKQIIVDNFNWHLAFEHLREKDTTKHVHRLHL